MPFKRVGSFHVYILRCADGTYYTGYSPDLAKRVEAHNTGKGAKYTRTRRPVQLVWSKAYRYFKHAVKAELAVKQLTRLAKEKLILGRSQKGHPFHLKPFRIKRKIHGKQR
jgi:putative endonuclease